MLCDLFIGWPLIGRRWSAALLAVPVWSRTGWASRFLQLRPDADYDFQLSFSVCRLLL